jgi:hypothetical protein
VRRRHGIGTIPANALLILNPFVFRQMTEPLKAASYPLAAFADFDDDLRLAVFADFDDDLRLVVFTDFLDLAFDFLYFVLRADILSSMSAKYLPWGGSFIWLPWGNLSAPLKELSSRIALTGTLTLAAIFLKVSFFRIV